MGPPDAVALDQPAGDLDVGVDLGPRQGGSVDERQEALFELAAGDAIADAARGEDGAEGPGAPPPGMATEEALERSRVRQPSQLGLTEGPLEPMPLENGR